jgi:D-alanyl-lipoteichoic acid acyltransferase DltB (MBOAT superfamily)
MVVFLLSGLWHGASWNFVLWGGYHGALLLGYRLLQGRVRLRYGSARLITQAFVFAGWLLFMDADTLTLRSDLATLVTPASFAKHNLALAFPESLADRATLALLLVVSTVFLLAEGRSAVEPYRRHLTLPSVTVMLFLTVVLVGHRSTEFIYFAF